MEVSSSAVGTGCRASYIDLTKHCRFFQLAPSVSRPILSVILFGCSKDDVRNLFITNSAAGLV